jgi:MFS family permease
MPRTEPADSEQEAIHSELREEAREFTAPASKQSKLVIATRALRHRNFQLFFSGQLISLIGTWMDTVAESWLVYRLTGSPLLLGTVAFCSQIPVFLCAPIGGAVADRCNRHRIIITTQALSMVVAFILAVLTLTHRVQVWQVMALAAAGGVINAFDVPARQAFLIDMVGREDLLNAIALNSSMFNGARIIGPAVAGVVVTAVGEGWCFMANSASYIAVITGLLLMKLPAREARFRETSPFEDVINGFRFVKNTAPIRAILLLLGLVSLVGMPYAVLMPVFAAQILHGGAKALGILMGCTGVGALLGAASLAARVGVKGLGKVIAFAAGGFGAAIIAFSFSHIFWLSCLMLMPVGFCMMVQMASSNTLVQSMVPDTMRGRVMSVYSMMFMGMAPFGAFFAGAIAHHIGAPYTVALGGLACIAGASLFALHLPRIRGEARELIMAQGMTAGTPVQQVTRQGA